MATLHMHMVHYTTFPKFFPKPVAGSTASVDAPLHLPPEIILRIVQLSDAPTLLQLMHVNTWIRKEAAKLFFSASDIYFHFPSGDLHLIEERLKMPILPLAIEYDLDFLRRVRNVSLRFDLDLIQHYDLRRDKNLLPKFWDRFSSVFPNARNLTITIRTCEYFEENTELRPEPQHWQGHRRYQEGFENLPKLISSCKLSLKIHLAVYSKSEVRLHRPSQPASHDHWQVVPLPKVYLVQPPRPCILGIIGHVQTLRWGHAEFSECGNYSRHLEAETHRLMDQALAAARRARKEQREQSLPESKWIYMEDMTDFLSSEDTASAEMMRCRWFEIMDKINKREELWNNALGLSNPASETDYQNFILEQLKRDPACILDGSVPGLSIG